jgi:DNA-binding response OmpR family regulator
MLNILIVEDNSNIRKLYRSYLERTGFFVLEATDGQNALNILEHNTISLMIVDVMMPRMDGYELTETLREYKYNFPILMITAKDRIDDKRQGFRLGSDDYMVKPIDLDEMILRVEALLRRSKIVSDHLINVGKCTINEDTYSVTRNLEIIVLPKKEFQLLYKLISYPSKIFTRTQLMEEIWGLDVDSDERTVDVHIKRIREKFDNWDDFEIITVRGLGYKVEIKNV